MNQLLDHPVISQRYFFPRPDEPPTFEEITAGDGVRLRYFEQKAQPATSKTLVHFHGNGETIADYLPDFSDTLVTLGLNVVFVEYRGYGGSGGVPQLGKMLTDVSTVQSFLNLDPASTYVYGRSVGAIFAVEWAYRQPNIAGLILESGVANPHQRLSIRMEDNELGVDQGTFDNVCREHLDHQHKLADFHQPLLLFHTERDGLVEIDHAEDHLRWAASLDKSLVRFAKGDHNSILAYNGKEILQHIDEFIQKC